ncbi:MAG: hypothetical protein Q9192_007702 [Flavoplaca navasiana]
MATVPFPQVASVPILDLTPIPQMDPKRVGTLIGDLNDLLLTVDCTMTDLVCCTDPSKSSDLWKESSTVVGMLLNMSKPVEDAVLDNSQHTGSVKALPASRYLDTTTVTFESLRECLRNSSDCVTRKFSTLREAFGVHFQSPSPMPSSRPLGEIVMEARLRSTLPSPFGLLQVKQWLVDFATFRSCEPVNRPLGFDRSRLTDAPNLLKYNLADRAVRPGNVACLAAGGEFIFSAAVYTHANAPNSYSLDTLKIGQGTDGLSDWFRAQRQARVGDAQATIDRLIGRFVGEYNDKLKSKFGHTELEWLALRRLKDKKTVEKRGILAGIREGILKKLHARFPGALPQVLVEYRKEVIGQAYEGQTVLLKSKCAVCQNVYPYQVPTNIFGHNPQPPPDYDDPAELSPKRLNTWRGCCAECLIFIPTMKILQMWSTLINQLA